MVYSRDPGGDIVEGTGIGFSTTNTITDSNNGLAVFSIGDSFMVSGSALNDGIFRVVTVAAGTITVLPAVVATESAGKPVELRRV